MPSIGTTQASEPFDLPVLLDSGTATLRMPIPMSEADYELLKKAITTNLEMYKGRITRQAVAAEDDE